MRKERIRIFAAMAVVFLGVSALWAGVINPRFQVISTIPPSSLLGVRGVARDVVLTVTFNQELNCSTVTNSTFTLTSGTGHHGAVAGTVACSGMVATFTPSSPLAANADYTATITNGVKDVGGQRLQSGCAWSFRTGSSLAAPTVTAVTPVNHATGVALNTKVTAAFDQAMNPHTINASTFTLTGPGNHSVSGAITYDALNNIATFKPNANLLPNTKYTATITYCVTNLAGTEMESSFVWTFTTGATKDVTPPAVISTNPANPVATCVPTNQIITATFSQAMASATITATTFTLNDGGPVSGTVIYAAVGNMATFTPSSPLTASTLYTATITTGVTDLAGNHMLSNYVWTFTTCTGTAIIPPTVVSTNPANGASGVCVNGAINITFSEPMDPATINTGTFTVTGPASAPVLGTVSLDVTGFIATFTPNLPLAAGTGYMATIAATVTDLFGNPLGSADSWSFTTGSASACGPAPLGAASPFGAIGGYSGITNQGTSTVINGEIGTTAASTLITGFHDDTVAYNYSLGQGCIYTETTLNIGDVTGGIYTAAPPPNAPWCPNEGTAVTEAAAALALADATTAYLALAGLPGGAYAGSGQLGTLTLAPGTYTSPTSFLITTGDLTLDAYGNCNAVWVFQMGSALTVGTPSSHQSVILTGCAQAKNVFWQVGSAATINGILGGGTMVGTIIAQAGISISTHDVVAITTLDGRAISLTGSVTMVNTVINVP